MIKRGMEEKELPPMPATVPPQQSHAYTMLSQSKKKKKFPYTWMTFFFLVALICFIAVVLMIV